MSSRFNNLPSIAAPKSDEETVAALVAMLSDMGIGKSRIDAMITKTARPGKTSRLLPKPSNVNDSGSEGSRRSA